MFERSSSMLTEMPSDSEEMLAFNGVDGATGSYLVPQMTPHQLLAYTRDERPDKEHLSDLRLRFRRFSQKKRGVKEGVDPERLDSAGWGIIFAYSDQDNLQAIKEALGKLLDRRREQAGTLFKEFSGAAAFRPGETKTGFLARHGVGPGPADPEKVPYYLLIVGDPEAIPYTFQYQLDVQYAVGRIYFDTLEEYAVYASSLVGMETGQTDRPPQAVFFGVQNQEDRSTSLCAKQLVEPLASKLAAIEGETGWAARSIVGESATKSALAELAGGSQTPALLFTASHGMGFPSGDPRQLPHQGALLCGDWPGPNAWRGPIPEDFYFSASDVSAEARLSGAMAFFFACYGAGTPQMDDFPHLASRERAPIAEKAFVSRLPQRLLSHPNGGMLAVVGHVERAWGYSFAWEKAGSQLAVFESALKRLVRGSPVGYAMEYFNERYAELSMELLSELQGVQFGKLIDEFALAGMWTANNDARSYVILGDPAARLPVKQKERTADERSEYSVSIQGRQARTREKELRAVIGAYKNALGVYSPEETPFEWAMVHYLAANLEIELFVTVGSDADRTAAKEDLEKALQSIIPEDFPQLYQEIQTKLERILNG
jgi:hypothetical protein